MRTLLISFAMAALFLGWNAPNHYPPWPAFHLELFAALALCFLAAAMMVRWPPPHGQASHPPGLAPLPLSVSAWVWLTLACWPTLQLATGTLAFRGDALIGLLYGMGVVLALYVGQLWALQQSRPKALQTMFVCFTFGAIAACGLGWVQWLRMSPLGWWTMELISDRPYANFAQPNHFGLLMVWGIVAVTALYESAVVQRRAVWGLAVAFLGTGLLMSQSRASALALVAVTALWFATRKRASTRLKPQEVLIGVTLGLAFAWAIQPLQQALLLTSTELRATPEVGPRQWIWRHFWAAVLERPWWGHGFNQSVAAMAEVADRVQPSRNVTHAHNVVLDLMTWVGMPIALATMLALVRWMVGWLRRGGDGLDALQQRHWVFAVWLTLLLQSMLEYPYAHSYFLLPAALLAGMITATPHALRLLPAATRVVPGRLTAALAAGTFALLCVTVWEYFRVEEDFRYFRFSRANFLNTAPHEPLAHPWVLDQLVAVNASALVPPARGMTDEQLERARVLARRFHILSVRMDYAKALALNGHAIAADSELTVIRSVYHPVQYRAIEREWRSWLESNQLLQ